MGVDDQGAGGDMTVMPLQPTHVTPATYKPGAANLSGVTVTDHHVPGPGGAPDVLVRVYAPEDGVPSDQVRSLRITTLSYRPSLLD